MGKSRRREDYEGAKNIDMVKFGDMLRSWRNLQVLKKFPRFCNMSDKAAVDEKSAKSLSAKRSRQIFAVPDPSWKLVVFRREMLQANEGDEVIGEDAGRLRKSRGKLIISNNFGKVSSKSLIIYRNTPSSDLPVEHASRKRLLGRSAIGAEYSSYVGYLPMTIKASCVDVKNRDTCAAFIHSLCGTNSMLPPMESLAGWMFTKTGANLW